MRTLLRRGCSMGTRANVALLGLALVAVIAGLAGVAVMIYQEKSGPPTELICPQGQVMVNYNLCVVGSRPMKREVERR